MKICTPHCVWSLLTRTKALPSEGYEQAAEVFAGPVGT